MYDASGPYDARAIANYLIEVAAAQKTEVSTLSLMKIVYFAHGTFLAECGRALVRQRFEAWENGPVIRVLWEALNGCHGVIPSTFRAKRFDPHAGAYVDLPDALPEHLKSFLRHVFSEYVVFSAGTLVGMTHVPSSPWHTVWRADSVKLGMPIENNAIRSWFDLPKRGH